jgi:hypothetical protein
VEAAGDLVAAALAELSARVQDGQYDLDRRPLFLLHDRHRDAASVVGHGHRVVGVDRDRDLIAMPGQRLVHRVVHNLVDEMVETSQTSRADVHARTPADGLEALQDRDVLGVIACLIFWAL